jgi:hypothetical protein
VLYYKSIRTMPTLLKRVISRVDHTIELSLLVMIISGVQTLMYLQVHESFAI